VLGNRHDKKAQPIITAPTVKNGGAHPNCKSVGKIRLPSIAPDLPVIIVKDTVIVLKVVGNKSTTTASITLMPILPRDTKKDDNIIVVSEF
jgi:hypothetical protein